MLDHPLELSDVGPVPGFVWLALLLGSGLGLFLYQILIAYRLVRLGKEDDRFRAWPHHLKLFLTEVLFQRKVRQDPLAGNLHAFIFWGFLLLASDMADLATGGRFEKEVLAALSPGLAQVWNLAVDLGYLLAWIGVSGGLARRLLFRPEKLEPSFEGNLILVIAFLIITTAFLLEGSLEAANANHETWEEPVGHLFAALLGGLSEDALRAVAGFSYWIHMGCLTFFLFLIPRSKHMHVVAAVLSTIFADTTPMGKMRTIDVEAQMERMEQDQEPDLGVVKVTDYRWKDLLDGFACTHCARCQEECPAHASGKVLNPMHLIHDLRDNLITHQKEVMKGPALLESSGHTTGEAGAERMVQVFTPEAIWACTTCFACVNACPVYIEHVPKLTEVRRSLVMLESDFPRELATVFTNLERQSNPWGVAAHQRMDWAEGLKIPLLADKGDADYLFYVGCAGAFDDRSKKVARDLVKLLQAAEVDFAVLGADEPCCGDPARRAGNEFLYGMLAQANVELFKELGIKKVITTCPHCSHTLGTEYPDLGWEGEVVHHATLLKELVQSGKLKLDQVARTRVTYHDPCYLGRLNGVIEQPRELLQEAGCSLEEMPRHGVKSFCCGAGGGRFWLEEEPDQRVNRLRAEEALQTGVDTVVVGCPFCMTMLEDGLKELGRDEQVRVLDLAEIVAQGLAP